MTINPRSAGSIATPRPDAQTKALAWLLKRLAAEDISVKTIADTCIHQSRLNCVP